MKSFLRVLIILLSIIGLTSCSGLKGNYNIALKNVENTNNLKGELNSEPRDNRLRNQYNDELITVNWWFRDKDIWFALQNNSSNTIEIIWDKAVYIDKLGKSNKVIHSGVKLIDKEKSQLPTVVIKGSKIDDILIPVNNISYVSGKYGGWSTSSLFPSSHKDIESMTKYDNVFKESEVKVLLPLMIDNQLIEYTFIFDVGDFVINDKD